MSQKLLTIPNKIYASLSLVRRCRLSTNSNAAHHVDIHQKPFDWWEEASLYVHWPYCQRRCTYCNFNKYIDRNVNHSRMADCLVSETETLLDLSQVKVIRSVFFGGGTPSLAEPDTIRRVLDAVRENFLTSSDMEVTLEANPMSSDFERLRLFKDAGINRLSIGVQSLREHNLEILGRTHSTDTAKQTLDMAKELFPGKVSIDLMFGLPSQTLQDWEEELEEALTICDHHISLYQLTLERGTELFRHHSKGNITVPDSDIMADMYESAIKLMKHAGFHQYEVSNFARKEYSESIHNKWYWKGGQYIGVGPGAHGRFIPMKYLIRTHGSDASSNVNHKNLFLSNIDFATNREARIQTLEPDPWMYEVEKFGHGTRKRVKQSRVEVLHELLLVGLRTRTGILLSDWLLFSGGVTLKDIFGGKTEIQNFVDLGFLEYCEEFIRATDKGLAVVDSIVPDLCNVVTQTYDVDR